MRLAGLIAAAAVLLAGCNGPIQEHFGQHMLRDGDHSILCVTWQHGYAGGLSCDWGHPR